jgi:hypothetical protein
MKSSRKYIVPALLVSTLIVAAFLVIRAKVTPSILRVHTVSLLFQLESVYRDSLTSGQSHVISSEAFLERVPQWTIDWNSCSYQDNRIYDSWNTPIEIRVEEATISLRSAGPDQTFNTADDLSKQITIQPDA